MFTRISELFTKHDRLTTSVRPPQVKQALSFVRNAANYPCRLIWSPL